jgi:hypothetical protein
MVSNLDFLMLGRIRAARRDGKPCDHDQVVEKLLERIGVHRDPRTRTIMTDLATRHALAAPLALAAPNWWDAFVGLYLVQASMPRARPRRWVDPRITAPPRAALPARPPFSFAAWLHACRDKWTDPA